MPRWVTRLAVALRSVIRPGRIDRELNEELQFHLDREIEEKLNTGLTPNEARRAAMRAMGPIEKNKEACRDLRRWTRFVMSAGRVSQDLRFAVRLFRRHPAPIGIAIGGLAAAIGVVTAVFSIVNATLLRPYGMDDPDSVVSISRAQHPAGWPIWPYADFLLMRRGTMLGVLEAAHYARVRFGVTAEDDGVADRPLLFVTGGYLPLFGGRAALGRTLGLMDDRPGAPAAIVVSDHFWRTELAADSTIVGKTVWVNDAPAALVGVLRPGFTGPVRSSLAVWATFAAFDDLQMGPQVTATNGPEVQIVGRLAPGVAPRAMQSNLTTLRSQSGAPGSVSDHDDGHGGLQVHQTSSPIDGADSDIPIVLAMVFALVGGVLALACANVAQLLMASALTRMREVGIRLAMGATRQRLVTQMITEGLLLAAIAGALGFLFAFWLVSIFATVVEAWPENDLSPDGRVFFFTLVVACVCGLGTGLAPARYGARGNVIAALQLQSGTRGAGTIPSRFRTSFVGVQAAVSMLLLVIAVLFTRSALQMTSVDIGFDADRLLAVSFDVPRSEFDEPAYIAAALEAVRGIPSVERVSVTQYAPFGFSTWSDRFVHDGRSFDVSVMAVDAEFVETAGVRVLRGRSLTADEVASEGPVVLISNTVAQTFFGGASPIGRSVSEVPSETGRPQRPATIVGVVADALIARVDAEVYGAIYRPLSRQRSNPPTLLIRTSTPGSTARAVEAAMRGIDVRVSATTAFVRDGLDDYLGVRRRLAWVLGPTAAMSLILAGLGVYGVTTFVVGRRTEEVSVRIALGASASDVLRLLATDSIRPVVVGLVTGLGLALVFSRVVAVEELPGISPFDPLAIGGAAMTLLVCALVAVVVPARRAARVDPSELLRQA